MSGSRGKVPVLKTGVRKSKQESIGNNINKVVSTELDNLQHAGGRGGGIWRVTPRP
jgi:hypothetical protein